MGLLSPGIVIYKHETTCKLCGKPILYENQWEVTPKWCVPERHKVCKRRKKDRGHKQAPIEKPCAICGVPFMPGRPNVFKCGGCKSKAWYQCACGVRFIGNVSAARHECDSCKNARRSASRSARRRADGYASVQSFATRNQHRKGGASECRFDVWALDQGSVPFGPRIDCCPAIDRTVYVDAPYAPAELAWEALERNDLDALREHLCTIRARGMGHCGVQVRTRGVQTESQMASHAKQHLKKHGDVCEYVAFVSGDGVWMFGKPNTQLPQG